METGGLETAAEVNGAACPPPTAKADKEPLRLSPEERLTLENYYLKAENLRLQQERLRQDFLTSSKMLQDLQRESTEFQTRLNKTYGVDVASFTVQPDGTLVPPKPTGLAAAFGTIGSKIPVKA